MYVYNIHEDCLNGSGSGRILNSMDHDFKYSSMYLPISNNLRVKGSGERECLPLMPRKQKVRVKKLA